MASELLLPVELVKDTTTWDFGHRIERADLHTREAHPWVNDMDNRMKEFMKANKDYGARLKMEDKCLEMAIEFRAFILFSETGFAKSRHGSYKVFLHLNTKFYIGEFEFFFNML